MTENVHAFGDDALGYLDAVGVAERIRSSEISAQDAVEAAIARVERVNPHLNAVAVEAFDRARSQARGPLTDGVFAGVPAFVKDNADVAGLPTRWGSAATSTRPARKDHPSAAQFLSPGYVLLGKATTPEFGLTASTEFADAPPTRNPWNTEYSVGASSGGSAALVASGAVPIAHANDGGGSIRIPAATNGLVGLKPTRARLLDRPGARQLPINISAEGAVTRTVRDTAHHLAAMERAYRNRALPAIGLVEGPAKRRLRIGLLTKTFAPGGVDPGVAATTREAADLFAGLGHEVTEIYLPIDEQFVDDFKLYWGLFAVLLTASHQLEHGRHFDPRKLDPFTAAMAKAGLRNMHRVPAAIRRLRKVPVAYDAMFTGVDVVLSPVVCQPTPKIGYLDPNLPYDELFARTTDHVGFTPLNNVSGGPAIALPFGLDASGLPTAIQVSAARGDEVTLLGLAYELEAAQPFPRIDAYARTV